MKYKQSFFINGKYYGSFPRRALSRDGIKFVPRSYLFYCEKCGEVYARCPVVDENKQQLIWTSLLGICEKCHSPSVFHAPGSIWSGWDEDFVEIFSRELLLREFFILLKYAE